MQSLAHPAHHPNGDTRELRALELYRTRGHEIRCVGQDLYLVPSCTDRGFYSVDYRQETCDCPDHQIRRENCKHILAVGVHVAKRRRQRPHACNDGWVTIGQIVADQNHTQVRDYLVQHIDTNDQLIVADLGVNAAWHGFNEGCSKWITNNLQA